MKTIIKEKTDFRLTLKKEPCLMPAGLNNIEMIQEHLKGGEVTQTSTYQFFMTQEEMNLLAKALTQ